MTTAHILIVDDNVTSTKMMAMLLKREGYRATTQNSPIKALKWLATPGNRPDMIISDLNMPEMSGHDFVKEVRKDPLNKNMPIIMLTAQSNMAQKVAGFEAGVDDYLVKPVSSTELVLRIKALLARSIAAATSQPATEATTITVFSLRGGVGTTSLSVNVAIALAQLWKKNVPLLDLSVKNGHCALMLNVKPKNTITQLCERNEEQLEADLIEGVMQTHKSGVKLMPAPLSPIEAELVRATTIEQIWPHFQANYSLVVIDGGSSLSELALAAFDRSNVILLLLAPELASLKAAVDMLQVFQQLDYEPERVELVLNQIIPRSQLAIKDMEAALRRRIKYTIPHDPNAFVQGINAGHPILESTPPTATGMTIAKLAYDLSPAEMREGDSAEPSDLLSRFK